MAEGGRPDPEDAKRDELPSSHESGPAVLLTALRDEDGLTLGEVAQRLHTTAATISRTARRMVEAGLLDRRRDDRDARLVRLHLTERGRAVLDVVDAPRPSKALPSPEMWFLFPAIGAA